MSVFKRIISGILTFVLILSVAQISVVTSGATGYDNGYTGAMAGDGVIYAHGIDVSRWQEGKVDFNDIKSAGYSYVVLRCGTTNGKDVCFESFYTQAKEAGLDVGTYYYSYATTVEESIADAEDCLSWIRGKKFEYPIYFDYENSSQSGLDDTLSAEICYAFLDTVKAAGYLPGLYSMHEWLESDWVTTSGLRDNYEGWVARHSYDNTYDKYHPTYSTRYGMFQYSATMYINDVGPFDADIAYKDYPTIVKTYGFNGYSAGSSPQGVFDSATGGVGSVKVEGWAFDGDNTSKSLDILVNIGGPVDTANSESFLIKADKTRADVNNAYGCGDNHGFNEVVGTSLTGEQPVYVYAYDDNGNCEDTLLGYKTVNIVADTENPVVSEVSIVSSDNNGYTLSCNVSDNGYLKNVYFPTWIDSPENAIWYEGTVNNGVATCTISVADFDEHNGRYDTHVYVYDSAGNYAVNGDFYTTFNEPTATLDIVEEVNGKIHVRGWAFDKDAIDEPLEVHVYVGGPAGAEGVVGRTIFADKPREDVDAVHGCGPNHGFDEYIATELKGTQDVCVYVINKGNGRTIQFETRTITISDDTVAPTIENVKIASSTGDSFTVSCDVADDRKVAEVSMAVWSEATENPIWYDMALENGVATGTVPLADFDNMSGKYTIHIYAYDSYGNETGYPYETTFNNPTATFDLVENKGGAIFVRGWAFDYDNIDEALEIHVYIGGEAGSEGAQLHKIKADTLREDIEEVYGTGLNHGFDSIITTDLRGEQTVYVYAINTGNGGNVFVGSKTVTITEPLCGDVDLDGEITVIDATLIQMHLAELSELSGVALKNADTTKDEVVSITDATTIQMYLAGYINNI